MFSSTCYFLLLSLFTPIGATPITAPNAHIPITPDAINPLYAPISTPHAPVSSPVVTSVTQESPLAPNAINPLYLNYTKRHDHVKRDGSGPLFGSSGKPDMNDIHQTTNPDCGFASSLAAVVNINSDWISSKISYSGSYGSVSSASVTMYDVSTLASKAYTVSWSDATPNSDDNSATGVWWPGLYDHAAISDGLASTKGVLGPILPSDALQAITGLSAGGTYIVGQNADYLFDLLGQHAAKNTPMVLQTLGDATTLVGSHAYAVLGTSGTGSGRQVTLYNPWGSQVTNSLDAVLADTYYIWYLKNYDTWTGGSSGSNNDPSTAKTTAQTSTNQPQPTSHTHHGNANAVATSTQPDDGVVWVTEVVTVTVIV